MEDWQTSRQGDKQTPMLGEQEEHIEHCSLATHHSSLDSTQNSKLKAQTLKAADICTGSGCIAVALAKHLPEALVIATDIDTQTLELARRNIQHHGMSERIQLLQGDLLDALPEPVDLLVSNPPYTIFDTIDEGVRRHEPRLALDGGRDGLDFYRRLLAEAPHKLCANATILLEIGADQGQAVLELASSTFPQASISIHRDLAGHERVVMVATAQTESRRRRQADADC